MSAMCVTAGQVVARLDPQNQQNALRSAQANLASAEAALTQARLDLLAAAGPLEAWLDAPRQIRRGPAGPR